MGAAACLLAVGAVAGCGTPDAVQVDAPEGAGPDAAACADLVDALPETVADQPRRAVTPDDAYAAAWGDPAIVLTCGGPMPRGFDDFATCTEVNGVGWFVAEEQLRGSERDMEMATIGRSPNVRVTLPPEYSPPATAMVDLAPAIKAETEERRSCV